MTSSTFKKPDLKAPRFRTTGLSLLNDKTYKKFIENHPDLKSITLEKFKEIVLTFNKNICKEVIENRDGVELPQGLGTMFLGSCQPPVKKKSNIDFGRSILAGQKVMHRNFATDGFISKIFYTSLTGYRFKHKEVWEFRAGREFSRTASAAYKDNFKKYIQVENTLKISDLYKKGVRKEWVKNQVFQADNYNEFNLD